MEILSISFVWIAYGKLYDNENATHNAGQVCNMVYCVIQYTIYNITDGIVVLGSEWKFVWSWVLVQSE